LVNLKKPPDAINVGNRKTGLRQKKKDERQKIYFVLPSIALTVIYWKNSYWERGKD
jgi:hypothetical protein